jgi:UDP-N-acetylglucosamine 2-epimerase (non-hydrolysing)
MTPPIKVMTILGTRPDIIKLSRIIAQLEKYTHHVLVHTSQNYDHELSDVFFKGLKIKEPDYNLNIATSCVAEDISNIITRVDMLLEKEKPDAVLFYGDTNTTLSVIPVKRRQIPIFHIEAGNRCFDFRVPEEINRKIIDHLSDVNMTISEHARQYLIHENISPERIIKVGSPLKEVYKYHSKEISASKILEHQQLKPRDYFLVSIHREDNVDEKNNLNSLFQSLLTIQQQYQKKIIISTHPRTKNKLIQLGIYKKNDRSKIVFSAPFGFFDYIKLQKNSFCVLSDSGSVTEESSILNFPAVTLRRMHERPEGMDEGVLIMTGLKTDYILRAIHVVTQQFYDTSVNSNTRIVNDYDVENVSLKVIRIILSYTDYVNRIVWRKNG